MGDQKHIHHETILAEEAEYNHAAAEYYADLKARVEVRRTATPSICSKCGKGLSAPESIAVGMGPICRDKQAAIVMADKLGGLNRWRANYEIVEQDDKSVLIRDLGPWDQHPTITNAAEGVVEELAGMLDGRKLHYIDSEGNTDQLLVVDGKFAGFKIIES